MKLATSLLLALGAIASPRVTWQELGAGKAYSFDEYLVDFHKSYPESQMGYRRSIFNKHLAMIRKQNADANASYHLHVNDFTDADPDEFRKMTRGHNHAARARRANALTGLRSPGPAPSDENFLRTLPDSVDWRKKGVVTPVKNQGGCGSCWAFSTAETAESHLAIATGKLLTLSEQQLVACAPNPDQCGGTGGCEGSIQPLGFKYIEGAGLALESEYPYQGVDTQCDATRTAKKAMTISGQVDLPTNNYTALIQAVANVGPVAISVDASAWQLYGGGVFDGTCGADIDHAVQAVGYGTDNGKDYWLVRNSWGSGWGEEGYIRIFRSSSPECATDKTPADGFGCKGGPSSIQVCGKCGILSGSSYPTGAALA